MKKKRMQAKNDWKDCKLGDLLKLKNGFAFKSNNYSDEGVPVLRIGDIKDWKVDSTGARRIKENSDYNSYTVKKGDILIAMSGATTGKFGIFDSDEKAYQNQRVGNLIPRNQKYIEKKFVFFLLYSLKRDIERTAYGGAQPNISATKIEALNTFFAPLPIQRAIVSKIENLFASLNKGIADLKKAQEQLKIYRKAVLKKAFEGGKHTHETVLNKVVHKIQIGPFGSQLHKKDYIDNGIPLINPMHIQEGKIKPNLNYAISREKRDSLPNYILMEGDVVMGRRGEMGRCGIVTENESGWFCGTGSLYLRPVKESLYPQFLYYYMRSSIVKGFLTGNATGTTMKNLNKKIVSSLPITLPKTIKEQKQIVKEIESRLSVCDKIEQSIRESLEKSEALRQSILKKAFEGELLSDEEIEQCKQEEDYEPAEVLLERIKKEKNK